MRERKIDWLIVCLVVAVSVLATLLAVSIFQEPQKAYGQGVAIRSFLDHTTGQVSEGAAGYVVALLGPVKESRLPFFVVDTKSQTLLIYEYDQSRRSLYLRVARSFRNDRELEDETFGERRANEGPSVDDVRKILRKNLRER